MPRARHDAATAPLFDSQAPGVPQPLAVALDACAQMLQARHGATKRVYRQQMVGALRQLTTQWRGYGR